MQWELLPGAGMRSGEVEVLIGADRSATRAAMARRLPAPESPRWPTEDQYDVNGAFMFLRYDDADTLQEIVLIDGRVSIDGLELLDTIWTELEPALLARGYSITHASYYADGHDCPEIGINVATRADVGGNGHGIERVAIWRPEPDA